MKYILASASPRRKELLTQAGFIFEVCPSHVEEKITKKKPHAIVKDLSFQKAWDIWKALDPDGQTVIGADTVVAYRGEILGKPSDEKEAFDMLSLLSGKTHQVYTGVTLIRKKEGAPFIRSFYEKTDVTFYPVSLDDLISYINTKDPLDKAGAYGIQGSFAIHVKKIHGDYNNVVGLPIGRLYQELKTFLP